MEDSALGDYVPSYDQIQVDIFCKTAVGRERIFRKLKDYFVEYFNLVDTGDPLRIYCIITDVCDDDYRDLEEMLNKDELTEGTVETYNLESARSRGLTNKGWTSWDVYNKYRQKGNET